MLEQIISRVRRMIKEGRQKLSVESTEAIEELYRDLVNLDDFIVKELDSVESNLNLDEKSKKAVRRDVFEQAARRLEVIKARSNYALLNDLPGVKPTDRPAEKEMTLLQFLQEKEIRDRLFGMTEAQILSHFGDSLFDGSNPLLLNAIRNAPQGFEPVSKEVLKKIQKADVRKLNAPGSKDIVSEQGLDSMAAEIFGLVQKELDNHRRKELPNSLAQSKISKERPFKF